MTLDQRAHERSVWPSVYIVVLNYNAAAVTLDCVQSIWRLQYPNFRLLVVENGSTDDSAAKLSWALAGSGAELLVVPQNRGIATGLNRGIERALAEGAAYILLMNNDILLFPATLTRLVETMERFPAVGAITGRSYSSVAMRKSTVSAYTRPLTPMRIILHRLLTVSGVAEFFGKRRTVARLMDFHTEFETSREVAWLMGALILARRIAVQDVGLWDENFFLFYEDTDWCLRVRNAGWQLRYDAGAAYVHFVGKTCAKETRARRITRQSCLYYRRKHFGLLANLAYSLIDRVFLYPLEELRHGLRALRRRSAVERTSESPGSRSTEAPA